jgi:hypothetical protein
VALGPGDSGIGRNCPQGSFCGRRRSTGG